MNLSGEVAKITMRTDAKNQVTTARTIHLLEQKETIHMISMLRKEPVQEVFMILWEDRTRQGCQGPHLRECAGVLVTHMEEEGEEQENEKEGEREDGKQRVEGRVVENQNNHIMSAWGWDEMKCAAHTKLEPMSMWH